jgi:DNA-binding NarL/FixJ family response regulator
VSEGKAHDDRDSRHQGQPHPAKKIRSPRVVVCSDTRLVHEGISLALNQVSGFDVVGQVQLEGAPAMIATLRPDVLLLDAGVVDGRELSHLLKAASPELRIVVFALSEGEPDIMEWAAVGVSGYVGRNGSIDDLAAAIQGATRGEAFCSPRIAGLLLARVGRLSADAMFNQVTGSLTRREQEIMALVEQGLANKEIARQLGIGYATVKNHVHRILEKMHSHNRGAASARMRRTGPAAPEPASDTKRCPAMK